MIMKRFYGIIYDVKILKNQFINYDIYASDFLELTAPQV